MTTLTFATGNSRKISEASSILGEHGIGFDTCKVETDEIQHRNPAQITKSKAEAAFERLNKPVVVSDTSWSIPALGSFPGGYMKDIASWLQPQDWLKLMSSYEDKRILCHEHIAYCDGKDVTHFEATYEGYFIDKPRGRDDNDESFEKVVILYGNKTMAEQLGDGEVASAGEDLTHWRKFAEWYLSDH